jgi:hypothetical protein
MNTVRQIVGAALILIGIVVAVHTVVEPLYHASSQASPYSPIWSYINPLMALAILLGLIFGYIRKQEVDREGSAAPVTRDFLAANTLFYGMLFVGILFFYNWFNLLSPAYTAMGPDAVSVVWAVVDAALPLLLGAQGLTLLRGNR